MNSVALRRSLLMLRTMTVAELAKHSGVSLATTKSFLHDHPDLVEPAGASKSAAKRGRPATRWRMRDVAVPELEVALRKILGPDAGEDAQSAAAIRDVLASSDAELDELAGFDRNEALRARQIALARRLDFAQAAIADLSGLQDHTGLDAMLSRARRKLEQLDRPLPVASAKVKALDDAISAYFETWLSSVTDSFKFHYTCHADAPPHGISAAPTIILDGLGYDHKVVGSVVENALTNGAPVVWLKLNEAALDQNALKSLGNHLQYGAGAFAQLVCVLDSDNKTVSGELARSLIELEASRSLAPSALDPWALRQFEAQITHLAHRTLAESIFDGQMGAPKLAPSPVAILMAGQFQTASAGYDGLDPSDALGRSHVESLCIDLSSEPAFEAEFAEANIGYLAGIDLLGGSLELPNPLGVRSDCSIVWPNQDQAPGSVILASMPLRQTAG